MDKFVICRFIIHKCYYELSISILVFHGFMSLFTLFYQSFLVPYLFFIYSLFIIYLSMLLNVDHLHIFSTLTLRSIPSQS